MTIGKNKADLTWLANEVLRSQPGCGTALVPDLHVLANVRGGRNWEIPTFSHLFPHVFSPVHLGHNAAAL